MIEYGIKESKRRTDQLVFKIASMKQTRKEKRYQVLSRYVDRLEASAQKLKDIDRRYFWIRLGAAVVVLVGIVLLFLDSDNRLAIGLLITGAVGFTIAVYFHRKVDASIASFKTARSLVSQQIARMNLEWDAIPPAPELALSRTWEADQDGGHPFKNDLEIVGEKSIQHLVDIAVSTGGSERLLSWLLCTHPDMHLLQSRQSILKELNPLIGFRGKLALNSALLTGSTAGKRWDGGLLLDWINSQEEDRSLIIFVLILLAFSVLNITLFLLNFVYGIPPLWILTLGLYGIIYNIKYRQYRHLFGDAYQLGKSLEQFRTLFVFLEKYPYPATGKLKSLCTPFIDRQSLPSRYLRKISLIISAASLQNNMILSFLVNVILPWDMYFTYLLQRYRSEISERLPVWLDAWYDLEALNSLANFAYLNPAYTYPQVQPSVSKGIAVFSARKIGHPLIPDEDRICNDFSLESLGDVILVTGSNMSGKSTFLRTLGVNLCIAYAGGPVNAEYLDTTLFRLFSVINVVDSLTDGISYFYAEVKRLKALLEAYGQEGKEPVFYLIDEIFRGTNNRERQIGSHAYVRALVGGNGVGVISTHDLELVHLSDSSKKVENYHFREHIETGRMVFDYKLRRGPCPTTNALEIMALEGLPVK